MSPKPHGAAARDVRRGAAPAAQRRGSPPRSPARRRRTQFGPTRADRGSRVDNGVRVVASHVER